SKAGALLRASAPTLGLSAPSVSLTNRSGGNQHSPAQGASSADLRLWCGQRCLSSNASSLVVTGGGVGDIACRPHSLGNLQVQLRRTVLSRIWLCSGSRSPISRFCSSGVALKWLSPRIVSCMPCTRIMALPMLSRVFAGDHQFARCWPLVAQADGIFRRRVDAVVDNQRTAQLGGVDGAQLAVGDEVVLDQQCAGLRAYLDGALASMQDHVVLNAPAAAAGDTDTAVVLHSVDAVVGDQKTAVAKVDGVLLLADECCNGLSAHHSSIPRCR